MSIAFEANEQFVNRHIGPDPAAVARMLEVVGSKTLDEFISSVVPSALRSKTQLNIGAPLTEAAFLREARRVAAMNAPCRSLIGMGYYGTITPGVILRNVLENPGWYTAYTPYQAEIAQGRLEALLNYQTMVVDLTGMEIANASLLDEATAAAEAMTMFHAINGRPAHGVFVVSRDCHPQTIAVVQTRAKHLDIRVEVGDHDAYAFDAGVFGLLLQYPATDGAVVDYRAVVDRAHTAGAHVVVAADLLALTLLTPPGEFGADAAVGSTQRFGVPMGYGGPHAAFLATRDTFKRHMPGRIIGVSVDAQGQPALRMALQTREQHIKRERATSNICTAQAFLATMSGMYAQYHGPEGIRQIAMHIFSTACTLAQALRDLGYIIRHEQFFDTVRVQAVTGVTSDMIQEIALGKGYNFWYQYADCVLISTDEVTTLEEINTIIGTFAEAAGKKTVAVTSLCDCFCIDEKFHRTTPFMQERTFNSYHSETDMMRYIKMLERKDFSLANGMIPLGSCTMKLNPAVSMFAMSWPEFGNIHPFVPAEQAQGYRKLMDDLGEALKEITGFDAVSFQPNSGAAGEYAGLMIIRQYHISRN